MFNFIIKKERFILGKEHIIQGFLSLSGNGEVDDILYLSNSDDPLAEELSFLNNKFCTVRYYISDKEVTPEKAQEEHLKQILGSIDVEYRMAYSDITGYLWTDESLRVGGHDLLNEFKSSVGKYLILIVEVDDENENLKEQQRLYERLNSSISLLDGYAKERGLTREAALEMYDSGKFNILINSYKNRIKR